MRSPSFCPLNGARVKLFLATREPAPNPYPAAVLSVGGRRIAATRDRTVTISASIDPTKGTDMTDVKDSNGTKLADGDSVTLIKDLKVKGTSVVLKRGTLIKNIRLTDKEGEIECNAEKVKGLVLRTEFLKKA
jgi:protein PhnA